MSSKALDLLDLHARGADEGAGSADMRPGLVGREADLDQVGSGHSGRTADARPAMDVDASAVFDLLGDKGSPCAHLVHRRRAVVRGGQVQVASRGDAGILVVKLGAQVDHSGHPPRSQPPPSPAPVLPAHVQLGRDLTQAADGCAGDNADGVVCCPPGGYTPSLVGEPLPKNSQSSDRVQTLRFPSVLLRACLGRSK